MARSIIESRVALSSLQAIFFHTDLFNPLWMTAFNAAALGCEGAEFQRALPFVFLSIR